MTLVKNITRLRYIDHLIRRKATGDLEALALKNNLSKRSMSNVIGEMKELGFPIKYDRSRCTYYYSDVGEMVKTLFVMGNGLSSKEFSGIGNNNDLCFSTITAFELCEKV